MGLQRKKDESWRKILEHMAMLSVQLCTWMELQMYSIRPLGPPNKEQKSRNQRSAGFCRTFVEKTSRGLPVGCSQQTTAITVLRSTRGGSSTIQGILMKKPKGP